jgi:hypothetical protein
VRSISLIQNAATALLLSLWIPNCSFAGGAEQQVCDGRRRLFPSASKTDHTRFVATSKTSGRSLRRELSPGPTHSFQQERFIDLNRQKKENLPNATIAIFALGYASVFFVVGMIGGFQTSTLAAVAILTLLVFGCVSGAVYLAFILVTGRTAHPNQNRLPMRGGEWWIR